MAVRSLPCLFLFISLFITYLVVNQYQSAPVIKQSNVDFTDFFPQTKKIPSLINRTQNIVGRFRCLKGWKQFGGACYYPSIMKSTPHKANQTCNLLQVNNIQLMRIRHPVEFSYAAHLYFTQNLTELLIETDPRIFKSKKFVDKVLASEQIEWQIMEDKLYQARLQFKLKTRSFNLKNKNTKNNSVKINRVYSSDEDKNAIERFNSIRGLCDQFALNIFNNDSHLVSFSTYKMSNKLVCSLSDVDLNSNYEYVCEYVLDFCFGNIMCGKHGECVNNLEGFKCSCSFFFTGVLCEKFADQVLQMIIGGIIVLILWSLLLIKKVYHSRASIKRSITECCGIFRCCGKPDVTSNGNSKQEGNISTRSIGLGILFFIFFCLLLITPVVVQIQSFRSRDIDLSESISSINDTLSALNQCARKSLIPMDEWIFLGISIALTIFFVLAASISERNSTKKHPSSTSTNKNVQSQKNDFIETNRRKGSNRRPPSNTEPQKQEEIPLIERPQTDRVTQLSDSTTQLSDGTAQLSDSTTQPSDGTAQLQDRTTQPSDGIAQLRDRTTQPNNGTARLADRTTQPSNGTARLSDNTTQPSDGDVQLQNKTTRPSATLPLSSTAHPPTRKRSISIFLSLSNSFHKMHRYETAAIFGILTSEILKVFDEILLAIGEASVDGLMIIFLKRIAIVFLIGLRYFPILISLRLRDVIVRFLAFAYVFGIIMYTIYRESFCLDFMPHSKDFSLSDEIQLRIQRSTGFIVYGLIANLPHFALLSYSGAEFFMRVVCPSPDEQEKDKKKEYLRKPQQETQPQGAQTSDNRSTHQKYLEKLYIWDDEFLYSSMVISTYTVNFLILYHLACTFSFLYTTRMMSSISFMTKSLEQLLDIEIKDRIFQTEIIVCTIITAIIYGIQLFLGMKNFRKHFKKYRDKDPTIVKQIEAKINKEQTRSRAICYPGYLIRYTMGGFVITFHILIFFASIHRLIWIHLYAFKWIFESLVPIFILFALQSLVAQWSSRLMDTRNTSIHRSQWKNNLINNLKNNMKNILQYFILVANCFIGIVSSVIRLMMGLIFNIVFMNRIDFCLFRDPLEQFDSANLAYWHFVHEEVKSTQGEQSDVESDASPESTSEVKKSDTTLTTSKEAQGARSVDTLPTVNPIWQLIRIDTLQGSNKREEVNEQSIPDKDAIDANHVLKEKQKSFLQSRKNIIKKHSGTKKSSSFTIQQQLAAIGCEEFGVYGDGNCFFRAISHQLYGNENQHSYIRSTTTDYLNLYTNDFAQFIDKDIDPTIENYIKRMKDDGSYADHLVILATASYLNKDIIIHEKDKKPLLIPSSDSLALQQLHVLYNPHGPHGPHYDSVISSGNNFLPFLSAEQVLIT